MRISIIGAGKVGDFLGTVLFEAGHQIVEVYNRSLSGAESLAKKTMARPTNELGALSADVDIMIISVKDDAIQAVADKLSVALPSLPLLAHTSGATPAAVLAPFSEKFGVFYPVQSFTFGRNLNPKEIPFCVWSNKKKAENDLEKLANSLSNQVFKINDQQRASLHVAAVFVNNFVNHLYSVGNHLAKKDNWPFELLLPLIQETALKVQQFEPEDGQTGPAIRGDLKTIEAHLTLLEQTPILKELYQNLTLSINPQLKNKLNAL